MEVGVEEGGVEAEGKGSERRRRRRRMGRMRRDGFRWEDMAVREGGESGGVGGLVYLSACNPLLGQSAPRRSSGCQKEKNKNKQKTPEKQECFKAINFLRCLLVFSFLFLAFYNLIL